MGQIQPDTIGTLGRVLGGQMLKQPTFTDLISPLYGRQQPFLQASNLVYGISHSELSPTQLDFVLTSISHLSLDELKALEPVLKYET